jgi:protein gp37
MGANSKIEWTHHTFNPWIGCAKVSAGCANCYAEELMDKRYGRARWGPNGTRVRTSAANWKQPLAWDRAAKEAGERHRVFCASLADVFEDREELTRWRSELWGLIDKTPNLDWLLLTKRPENVNRFSAISFVRPNVWIGTSVEDQESADKRIPLLMKVRAVVRFLSCEPLLGPVELNDEDQVDWVIVGGESGRDARPVHPAWAESLRDQCIRMRIAFHFKQWGEFRTTTFEEAESDDPRIVTIKEFGDGDDSDKWPMTRVGKHAAGRELGGVTWDQFPQPQPVEAR